MYIHTVTIYIKCDTASDHVTAGEESLLSGAEARAYLVAKEIVAISKSGNVDINIPGYSFLSKMQSSLDEPLQLESHLVDLVRNPWSPLGSSIWRENWLPRPVFFLCLVTKDF